MLRHLVVLLAVKIGEVYPLFGPLGLLIVCRSELGHISHLDSFLLLSIAKHIIVVLFGQHQLADLWFLLIEPLFVGVLTPILRLEVLMLYITIIISVRAAALSFLPWSWVNAVSDVDHPVVQTRMRFELLIKLLDRHKGYISEVPLPMEPLLPCLPCVHYQVLGQPLLVLSAHLLKEHVTVFNYLSVLLQIKEEKIDIEFGSVELSRVQITIVLVDFIENAALFLGSSHTVMLVQVVSCLILKANDRDVEAIEAFIVLEIDIGAFGDQELKEDDVPAESCPH